MNPMASTATPDRTVPTAEPAATEILAMLDGATKRLFLPPVPIEIVKALAEALALPMDDSRCGNNVLVPGRPPFEISFVEAAPRVLRFDFEPCGPDCSPEQRRHRATGLASSWIEPIATREATRQFRRYLESFRSVRLGSEADFGAFLGITHGDLGLEEVKLYFELDGSLPEGLPTRLSAVADKALASLPGLAPHFASIACGRHRCISRLYFLCREEFPMIGLYPVLAEASLDHRLPELISLTVALTGCASVLPAGAAVLSFREQDSGIDCKLELLVRALRFPPRNLIRQLHHLVSERPRTREALLRWSQAFGAEDLIPGELNVTGFRASQDQPAQLGLYASPARGGR